MSDEAKPEEEKKQVVLSRIKDEVRVENKEEYIERTMNSMKKMISAWNVEKLQNKLRKNQDESEIKRS